jgi:ribose transport system substrate-binding protein
MTSIISRWSTGSARGACAARHRRGGGDRLRQRRRQLVDRWQQRVIEGRPRWRQARAQRAQRPTQIPVSQLIGKPIPTGKRIDFINCGVGAQRTQRRQDARLDGQADQHHGHPGSVQAQSRPSPKATRSSPVFPRGFSQQLKQPQMKIPVVESSTDDVEGGIDLILSKPKDLGPEGQILASWITKDSGGKAHTLRGPAGYNISSWCASIELNYAKLCAGTSWTDRHPADAIGKDA